MKQLSKGEQTRKIILERVNTFFNEHGVDHTITNIASHIGMGKSRMTNYFPRKEQLIVSLLKEYEAQLTSLMSKHQYERGIFNFTQLVPLLSDAMELMFNYRGVISFAMINPAMDSDIFSHIKENYKQNKERIRERLGNFVQNGLLKKNLLEPDTFEEYFFQYMCMSSNWIISYNLLDSDKTLEAVKTRYIRSTLCCLHPYLTEKGHDNLKTAFMELDQVPT